MDSSVSADDLSNSFELVAKSEGNNNITVRQSTARYIKVCSADNDAVVVEGTSQNLSFQVVPPAREVSYYISTINQDGTVVKSSAKSLNVTTFTDLPVIFDAILVLMVDLELLLGRGTILNLAIGAMVLGEVIRRPVGGVRPIKLILMSKLRGKACQTMEPVLGSRSI